MPEPANEPPIISVSVEGRDPEPLADVWPRLVALIDDLRAIPGVRARIDVNVTVTMAPSISHQCGLQPGEP